MRPESKKYLWDATESAAIARNAVRDQWNAHCWKFCSPCSDRARKSSRPQWSSYRAKRHPKRGSTFRA